MGRPIGTLPMVKCECGFIHVDGGENHDCNYKQSRCPECGLKHDDYSSITTGISPCLAALRFELEELQGMVKLIVGMNHYLAKGAGLDIVQATSESHQQSSPHDSIDQLVEPEFAEAPDKGHTW